MKTIALVFLLLLSLSLHSENYNELSVGFFEGKATVNNDHDFGNAENIVTLNQLSFSWIAASIDEGDKFPNYFRTYFDIPLNENSTFSMSVVQGISVFHQNRDSDFFTGFRIETGPIVFIDNEGIFSENPIALVGVIDVFMGSDPVAVHLISKIYSIEYTRGMTGLMLSIAI